MRFGDLLDFDHFFFDLDGTLSDSKADVLGSIEQAYKNLGFSYDKSKLRIGPLLPDIISAISPALNEEERALAARTFRAVYAAGKYKNTVLFEGVAEFLDKLLAAGKTLYVATNKPKAPTYEVLEKLGIKDKFLFIGTPDCMGDSLTKPEVLKMIVSMFDLEAGKCLMVGLHVRFGSGEMPDGRGYSARHRGRPLCRDEDDGIPFRLRGCFFPEQPC